MLRLQIVGLSKGFRAKGEYLQCSAMLVMWLCELTGDAQVVRGCMGSWGEGKIKPSFLRWRQRRWAFIASHIMGLCSVVGSDNHAPFIFFSSHKRIHCIKHGFIPQHERCLAAYLILLKLECDLAVLVDLRNGFTATGMLVSMWDSAGEEEIAEKGIAECHKARSSVVVWSVILQKLLAAGSLPLAPRWWCGVI